MVREGEEATAQLRAELELLQRREAATHEQLAQALAQVRSQCSWLWGTI